MQNASKGGRGVCFEAWNKAIKRHKVDEEEFSKRIRNGYVSYMRNRQAVRNTGEFVPHLKMLSSFLNQDVWDDIFEESTGELLLKAVSLNCTEQGCKEEALYVTDVEKLCQRHYLEKKVYPEQGETIRIMKEVYGPPDGQTWKQWAIGVVKKIGVFENA